MITYLMAIHMAINCDCKNLKLRILVSEIINLVITVLQLYLTIRAQENNAFGVLLVGRSTNRPSEWDHRPLHPDDVLRGHLLDELERDELGDLLLAVVGQHVLQGVSAVPQLEVVVGGVLQQPL